MLPLKQYQQPASFIGFMASAIALLAATTIVNNAKIASLATLAGTVSIYGYVKTETENTQARLKNELETTQTNLNRVETLLSECKDSETSLLSKIKPYILPDGSLLNVVAQTELIESLRESLTRMGERLQISETTLLGVRGERESLKLDIDRLNGQITALEGSKLQWSKKFDEMITDHDSEVDALKSKVESLTLENLNFKAQFSSVDEVARLRASAECRAIQDKLETLKSELESLNTEYVKVGSLYNSLRSDHVALNAQYVEEFNELNQAVSVGIPETFNEVLNARDQELLRLSGSLNQLLQPHKFHQPDQFSRADKLIDLLYQAESPITLDASEIVPIDYTRFDAFYSLRDRKAMGRAMIDHLNSVGEECFSQLACIKPIKFDFDPVNPHRIKATFIHKQQKAEPKTSIDKLWVSASQFEKIYKLLKKPVTRVMGSTGEGKGIFVNLLLALEANQSAPTFTRLHDPMNGSSEDYWQISKTSKGKTETTKAVKSFITEFNDRLEKGISEPKTLDVFDEIDILADSDSSVNKDFLNSSKGMRHCGMRAYLIGQSPSVGKKGFEWADMDNFNAVYFGSAIVTAIEKTPSLSSQTETLRKTFDKLKSFCDSQNDEGSFDEGNLYRLGLLVTSGKALFFELPSADSIPCDWSKLTTVLEPIEKSSEHNADQPSCQHLNSIVKKTYKDEQGNPVRKNRKCKDCGESFTERL